MRNIATSLLVVSLFLPAFAQGGSNGIAPEGRLQVISGSWHVENSSQPGSAASQIPLLPLVARSLGYSLEGVSQKRARPTLPRVTSGLLSSPAYGDLRLIDDKNQIYEYVSHSESQGRDGAELWVKTAGKEYKLLLRICVVGNKDSETQCPSRKRQPKD